jgi:hypothetical protein
MKRLAIAAVGLALVVGIVVGGMVGRPSEGKASASTATQAREDQITIFSQAFSNPPQLPGGIYGPLSGDGMILLGLDPADYPSSSTFRLEGVWDSLGEGETSCLRLFDRTTGAPVVESEACHTDTANEYVRVRSLAFSLPAGEHEYTLEGKCVLPPWECLNPLYSARLIVDWTEAYAVGGFAELPPLASAPGTGTSGMGGATYAVMAGAAAGVLAFAVLATLSVKRRAVK